MPFRIAKTFTVESGHLLTKHPGACRFPHGHSRTIEVVVTSDALDDRDMVCDFAELKLAAAEVVACFDHTFVLNSTDPACATLQAAYGDRVIAFPETDPTTEILAREIFSAIRAKLETPALSRSNGRAAFRLERIRVSETASSWAEYWE